MQKFITFSKIIMTVPVSPNFFVSVYFIFAFILEAFPNLWWSMADCPHLGVHYQYSKSAALSVGLSCRRWAALKSNWRASGLSPWGSRYGAFLYGRSVCLCNLGVWLLALLEQGRLLLNCRLQCPCVPVPRSLVAAVSPENKAPIFWDEISTWGSECPTDPSTDFQLMVFPAHALPPSSVYPGTCNHTTC